ncbi:NAD(P)H-binding protein [Camelimonas lactis]|uniref:Putative NAD(P)-binding protein n=1 Tax=Camelimonas lactis TaxID=659006 RepID=A0A4R2GSQ0_9HYPH|nr:NAD(P)H-binding protein [Camelimonas lactis]TCO13371.1 putative NAD(P)-binding protein [Camelimonas lactis]
MTLFVRDADKLSSVPTKASVFQDDVDVLDRSAFDEAIAGQDVVYANLTGENLDDQARSVVASMHAAGVKRLIFVLDKPFRGTVVPSVADHMDNAADDAPVVDPRCAV